MPHPSQSLRPQPYVVERDVTLAATSGTTVGPTIPPRHAVLAAGMQVMQAVPSVTTYTVNMTDGTTTFASALNFNNTAAGTTLGGFTAGLIGATADTVDAVTTISGAPGTISARIWALVVDIGDQDRVPGAVPRTQI